MLRYTENCGRLSNRFFKSLEISSLAIDLGNHFSSMLKDLSYEKSERLWPPSWHFHSKLTFCVIRFAFVLINSVASLEVSFLG